jgi:hypothetical protein
MWLIVTPVTLFALASRHRPPPLGVPIAPRPLRTAPVRRKVQPVVLRLARERVMGVSIDGVTLHAGRRLR